MNPRTLSVLLALGAACTLATPSLALDEPAPAKAPEKKAAKLVAGMPAPEFKVEKFVKGTPFTSFEKGKLYVVEFWATWCGPCIMSMPHLTELQREYASKNLTIVGVNVREEQNYSAATFDKVSAFVTKRGDRMGYSVAYDGEAKFMESNWMKAADARGIPTAFLVDKTGTIAWIGHPAYLDMVLDEVTKGTWDIATGEERLDKATGMFEEAGKKYADSVEAGDTAWANATKAYPVLAKRMGVDRVSAMMEGDRFTEAAAAGTQVVESALKSKSHGEVLELLQTLADPDTLKQKPLRVLLLKAAQANLELGDATLPGPHVALARAYYFNNEPEKAKAEREQALKLSPESSRAGLEKYLSDAEEQAKNN